MKKHIPNLLTLLNLFCGCCAFVYALQGEFQQVAILLLISGVADFFDGLTARWLGVASPIGKELDSLADVVSFGVVPAAFFYYVLNHEGISFTGGGQEAFVLALFAALRLAKFNIDTRQTEHFIGLNTPSCTMFVAGLMLMYYNDSYGLKAYIVNPYFLYPVIAVLSLMMVSPLPMFGFKIKGLQWKGYESQLIFVAISILFLVFFRELGLSLVILTYVSWNVIRWMLKNTTN
jgi:CDP-diacylglycerol--serine O-phosphatidyltransferase